LTKLNNSKSQGKERIKGEGVNNPAKAVLASGAGLKAQGNQI